MENIGIELSQKSLIIITSVVIFYVLSVTLFGTYFSKFNSDLDDFFYSGQRFSWWLPAASMMATGIGSYSFLKYSEQGYQTGLSSSLTYLNDWFVMPFFIFGWLPIIYYSKVKSIPEYFERRFNRTARVISLTIILAYMFFYIGYNLYTVGVATEALFGIEQTVAVPLIALFLGVYVTFGGQTAVIFTDLFQGLMLFIGGILAVYLGLNAIGGFDQFWSYLPVNHRLPFVDLVENEQFNTAGLFWGEALAGSIAFAFMNQGFIMRYLTIKNVNDGRKAAFFNLLITMPLCAIIVGAMGWIAKSIITKQSAIGEALAGYDFIQIDNTYHTFLIVCWNVVKQNPWIFGFIIASLLAALMSTIDTLINACAAVIIYDIYKPYIKPEGTDKHYLKVARIASILSTLVGLMLVIIFNLQEGSSLSLMSLHYKGIMVIIPSIVTTIFLGAFWSKFHSIPACVAMVLGSLLTILTLWYPEMIDPLAWFVSNHSGNNYIYIRALFGMVTTSIIGVGLSLILKNNDKTKPGLTVDSIQQAKLSYKNHPTLNELEGAIIKNMTIELDENIRENQIVVPLKHMEQMKAEDGDLIYISDSRWFLGGLRAGHVKAFAIKGNGVNNTIRMSTKTMNQCYLLKHKPILLEKIF